MIDGWCPTKKKFEQRLHDIKGRRSSSWRTHEEEVADEWTSP